MSAVQRRSALGAVLVVALLAGCTGNDGTGSDGAEQGTTTSPLEQQGVGAGGGEADGGRESADDSAEADGLWATIPDIIAQVQPSVVAVQHLNGEGSGVIVDPAGLVVTNFHVVERATSDLAVVLATGEELPATIVGTDPLSDLAVLRVEPEGELPAATLAEDLPVVGELAVAMGNPLGFENTATAGIISGLQRTIPGPIQETRSLIDLIQTDAAISPGNSGGALVNADAEVVGINVAYLPPSVGAVSLGFAIPAATVRKVVDQISATGEVRHAYLGVQPASLTPQIAEQFDLGVDEGVLVLQVVPGGPADGAGLEAGDVIVELGGEAVDALGPFLAQLRGAAPGDTLDVTVLRNGERLTLSVQLGERP